MITRWVAVLFTLLIFLVVAWAAWEARTWPLKVRLTPWVISIPTAVLLAVLVAQEARRAVRVGAGGSNGATSDESGGQFLGQAALAEIGPTLDLAERRRRTASILLWILGFALGIWLLGFHYGVPLATFLYLRFTGREGWRTTLALTVAMWAFIALFFDCTVHILFFPGELFTWLGVEVGEVQTAVCGTVAGILPR